MLSEERGFMKNTTYQKTPLCSQIMNVIGSAKAKTVVTEQQRVTLINSADNNSYSVYEKSFTWNSKPVKHQIIFTREKMYCCKNSGKDLRHHSNLIQEKLKKEFVTPSYQRSRKYRGLIHVLNVANPLICMLS